MSIPILIDNNNNIDIDNGDFRAILRIVLGEGDYYGMQKYWQILLSSTKIILIYVQIC